VKLVILKDDIAPAYRQLAQAVGGQGANEAIGKAVSEVVRDHLEARNLVPNKLGGPKTNFWARLAGGVSYVATVDSSEVSVPAPARQKYLGGVIRPSKPGGVLIFPISAATYGKTFREWRQANPKEPAKGLWAFAKSVNQQPDPNTLPPDQVILDRAAEAITDNLAVLTEL